MTTITAFVFQEDGTVARVRIPVFRHPERMRPPTDADLLAMRNGIGAGADLFPSGSMHPEGNVTGAFVGQPYFRTNGDSFKFNGTPGTNIGWT